MQHQIAVFLRKQQRVVEKLNLTTVTILLTGVYLKGYFIIYIHCNYIPQLNLYL